MLIASAHNWHRHVPKERRFRDLQRRMHNRSRYYLAFRGPLSDEIPSVRGGTCSSKVFERVHLLVLTCRLRIPLDAPLPLIKPASAVSAVQSISTRYVRFFSIVQHQHNRTYCHNSWRIASSSRKRPRVFD